MNPPSPRFRAVRGVTLTELLVILAIVGVLTGLALPGMTMFGRSRVANQINDLNAAIHLARSEAVKRRKIVSVVPESRDWTKGWSVVVDENKNAVADADEVVILRHEPLVRTTTVSHDTTPGYVAYGYDGQTHRYNGGFLAAAITLCDNGKSSTLVLAKGGRVRLVNGTC